MKRLLRWLLLSLVFHNIKMRAEGSAEQEVACHMQDVNHILSEGNADESARAVEELEQHLERAEVNGTIRFHVGSLVALLHSPGYNFQGLELYANETKAGLNSSVSNTKVKVQLPRELATGPDNNLVFCMISGSQTNGTLFGIPMPLYENRLIGLSVGKKNISGLQQRINITMNLTMDIQETQILKCVFYNFSTKKICTNGCKTLWDRGRSQITCSCNHLTYFGVLMIPAEISSTDEDILTYITLIGCSLSLFALVITVFLFIINRNVREDVSMKIHINLAIALILLNIHFLPSNAVAALSSTWPCFYTALCLHYSLLASFSWMALEGFHIYLLIVRVFNIYIQRYVLKLAAVGWGIPAVIVVLVLIIKKDAYGRVHLDSSNNNSSLICYITDDTVKMVTTVGVFGLVFIFNVCLFTLTVKRVLALHHGNESKNTRVRRDICTLMGLTVLLGISWGLIFFSFGYLTTPGLYIFCILNSLQGFFIFLWFLMSLRKKKKNSATQTGGETNSTNN